MIPVARRFFACALAHLALGGLALAGLAPAAFAGEDAPIIVPTEMCRGYWFVPITLSERDGYPEDRTLWFIYDTGASSTYVDPDSLARVSNRDFSGHDRVNIVDATAGPVNFNRVPARVRQLDHLSLALGRQIDGILEVDAFEDFLMTLDYQDQELRLERGELPRPDNIEIFDSDGPDMRPWMPVRVAGQRQRLLIDSGSGSGFTLNRIDRFPLESERVRVHSSTRINRMERRSGARLDGELRMGGSAFLNPVLIQTPDTQLFGSEVMKHFEWTFDQRNERVRVRRYDRDNPLPTPGYASLGLELWGANGVLEVRGVVPGSPGEASGLEEGDAITHWNGVPVGERGCSTSQRRSGPTLLTVRRGDVVFETPIEAAFLID